MYVAFCIQSTNNSHFLFCLQRASIKVQVPGTVEVKKKFGGAIALDLCFNSFYFTYDNFYRGQQIHSPLSDESRLFG